MSNISSIRLSGTTYSIKDASATTVVSLTQAQYDALVTKDPNTLYNITDAQGADLSNYYTKSETSGATEISTALNAKQDTLVSGTNIKTINNESILGSGNIEIQGGGKAVSGGTNISITTGETADTINCTLPISAGTGTKSIKIGGGTSSGIYSLAGGAANSKSLEYASFAWGEGAEANVSHSTVFGFYSNGNGDYSFVNGEYVNANNKAEHSQGRYNVSNKANNTWGDSGNTLFSVGNGTSRNARHNAFEIRQNGDIYITSGGTDIKLQDNLGGGGASYSAGTGIDITNDVISVTGKVDTSAITTSITSSSTDAQVPSAKAVNDKLGGLSLIKLTQSEYDALATKDNNTLYVIVSGDTPTPTPTWVTVQQGDNIPEGSYSNLRISSATTINDDEHINFFDGTIYNYIGSYCTETQCIEYDEETGDCLQEECVTYEQGYGQGYNDEFDPTEASITPFTFGQDGYWYSNIPFDVEVFGDYTAPFDIEVLPNNE